jgi:tetratricopeptide (TPR) repeat protein
MRTGNEQKRGLPLVAGIAGGIVILVAAVWYVIASMIDSLNENSARLHELHVKPNTAKSMEMSAANEFLGKSDAQRSAKKVDETETESVHKEADRLYGQGCTALKRGDYPTAIDLFTKSHHLMADEMHRGITDVQDDVGIAARFAALGYCYYKVGNYDAAEKELTAQITIGNALSFTGPKAN